MSVSRSAIIVAGVALLEMFAGLPNRWRLAAFIAAPIAAVAGRVVLPGLLGTIRSLFTGLEHDPSIAGRTADYSLVFASWASALCSGRASSPSSRYRTLDNQALVLLLELGVVGTLAFVGLLAAGFTAHGRLGVSAKKRSIDISVWRWRHRSPASSLAISPLTRWDSVRSQG